MNRRMARYYLRRLGYLKLGDVTQRLRLRGFHKHHSRILAGADTVGSLEQFFPGEEASFRQLSTTAGVRAVGPHVTSGWIGDDSFWDEFASVYPSAVGRIIFQADAIRSYRITLFGWKELQLCPPIRWSDALAPDHPGLEWPTDHYAAIDFFRHAKFAQSDVKWCWELNRFQHLLCLGAAWRITHEEIYAKTACEHIASWLDQVQYPLGVQWSSNLEAALRMLSWARCHLMCANSTSWDDEFLMRFIPCLYAHACHVDRELTVHHTVGNHLLGEACSLIQLYCLYKGFPMARPRLERSRKIAERLVPTLILSDGVYSEQSTGYLKFVLEFLASVMPLMDTVGVRFSDQLRDRIAAALEYICSLAPDLYNVPMIGDCDSGSAIGWGLSDYWDYEALVMALCSLLQKSPPVGVAEEFPAESFLIAGKRGLNAHVSMRERHLIKTSSKAKSQVFREFPQGGYQVSTDSRLHLILDGGPLGISPGYGHGHADGLSFVLSIDGGPFVVDPGTMLYNGAPYWRNYFRGASAHNTVRMDERDPARPIATFLWSNPVEACLEHSRAGDGWRLLQARQKTRAFVHTRSIIHWYERGVVVGDIIQGRGTRGVDCFLHFHPDWVVAQEDVALFTAYRNKTVINIQFYGCEQATSHSHFGSLDPILGWYSSAYGKLEPCTSLQLKLQAALPVRTLFVAHFPNQFLRIPPELAEYFSVWENTRLQ